MPAISAIPDAMSNVLSLVRMRGEVVCSAEFKAPWSLSFASMRSHFHIIQRGSAWVTLTNQPPIHLETGDLVILPLGAGHVLSSDPSLTPIPLDHALQTTMRGDGHLYRIPGHGEQTDVLCGRFSFAGVLAPRLLTVLPPLLRIQATQGHPLDWLRLTSHFLVEETRNPRPGSTIMIERLLDLLFIQAIRTWGSTSHRNLSWLSGLRDDSIGKALAAIHDNPAYDWTVEALADIASLSRSAFASRFAEIVGQTPLKYLAIWRLDLAADQLRAGTATIAQIATAVGYSSESALTRAFKAQFHTTPAAFRRHPNKPLNQTA